MPHIVRDSAPQVPEYKKVKIRGDVVKSTRSKITYDLPRYCSYKIDLEVFFYVVIKIILCSVL